MQVVDPSEKGSESEDMSGKTPDRVSSMERSVKTCADCGTTKTPLWRGGPAGPKSLCNACGIRSRKKRRALLGPIKGGEDRKSKKATAKNNIGQHSSRREGDKKSGLGDSMRKRLFAFGREMVLGKQKQRSKLGEEEQAAVLLMALSYGSVYA